MGEGSREAPFILRVSANRLPFYPLPNRLSVLLPYSSLRPGLHLPSRHDSHRGEAVCRCPTNSFLSCRELHPSGSLFFSGKCRRSEAGRVLRILRLSKQPMILSIVICSFRSVFCPQSRKRTAMTQIRIKRVYAPAEENDGFRVLIDRLWPRGMRRTEVHYDLWAKEIAPSSALRQWYHADSKGRRKEFSRKYTEELRTSDALRPFIESIACKPVVTLLYASKNASESHAPVLQEYLRKVLADSRP